MFEDKDISILVIDDDAMVLEVLQEYLESFGFTNVTCVGDSVQANSLIRDPSKKWEMVISDWEMPNFTGLNLLKAVRSLSSTQYTKFIIVTSQQSMERFKITQAAYSQVDAYIVKPFRSEILKEKIWAVMGWDLEEGEDGDEKAS